MMKRAFSIAGAVLLCFSAGCVGPEQVGLAAEPLDAADFTAWRQSLYREPGARGAYIVDVDIPIAASALRAYYEAHVLPPIAGLIVDENDGSDDVWSAIDKLRITYCVSDRFGARKSSVVRAMRAATKSWEQAAHVKFSYRPARDATCTPRESRVVFDVRPTQNAPYLARSFFPKNARALRSVLIDSTAQHVSPPLTLAGILRHEMGHVLGLRHEHTRPQAHACYEDDDWRPLTPYDPASVMHYPQCNGTGDWSLTLTAHDKEGIAALYGPPPA
jgi:hypothetical protein